MQLIIFLLLFLYSPASYAEIIDPSSPPDSILDNLADSLGKKGIDVRRGGTSNDLYEASRPQLSRLDNFPISSDINPDKAGKFSAHFKAGVLSEAYLLAVKKNAHKSSDSYASFRKAWKAASKQERIFISFSGKDIDYAETIKAELEESGYKVFLYKTKTSKHPVTNSVEVGKYFKEAGQHFVIDSKNARASKPVNFEAAILKTLKKQISHSTGTKESAPSATNKNIDSNSISTIGRSSPGMPCCKLCTYMKGILIRCGPVECGTQCLHATPYR